MIVDSRGLYLKLSAVNCQPSTKIMNSSQVTNSIIAQGILPLYFNADETVSIEVLRAIYRAGVRAVEYTNRGKAALQNFTKLIEIRNAEMPDLLLGIGTIKNVPQAKAYKMAGADFFVSPGFVLKVAKYARKEEMFYAPGCMTPSEIIAAENAGIGFIKLFPGDMLGPKFLSSIKDIFPDLLFMPTGGVDTTLESVKSWFDAGVCAVGMGSKLISKKLMEDRDYATIEAKTVEVLALISKFKK